MTEIEDLLKNMKNGIEEDFENYIKQYPVEIEDTELAVLVFLYKRYVILKEGLLDALQNS